ncbi:MAG: NAD(P)-binding domain-containing protein [Tetrasphaera sp.]
MITHDPPVHDRTDRYCIIGAGAGGLTAAKNLLDAGVVVDVIERESALGGIWNPDNPHSPAYRSIHLITSKRWIEYTDFPIPEHYPTYLGLREAHTYLSTYAVWSGVRDHIEFGRTACDVDRTDGDPAWLVTLDNGERRRYAGLVIANGHNSQPRWPELVGDFDGPIMHAAQYDEPSIFDGRRVLVIGGGTSGADIAVEASARASATFLSVRRGCYYWPKHVLGMPTDEFYERVLRLRIPRPLLRSGAALVLRASRAGDPAAYGLPTPPHKLLEEHFVINTTLLYNLGHGAIGAKPAIERLDGDGVRFTDGTRERIDLIVCATGYEQTYLPFIDRRHLNWTGSIPGLHLHAFHPDYDNLFVVGLFQTSTGNWQIMDYQAQVIAQFIYWMSRDPARVSELRRAKAHPRYGRALAGGINFYDSDRHQLQVDHVTLRDTLRRLSARYALPREVAA